MKIIVGVALVAAAVTATILSGGIAGVAIGLAGAEGSMGTALAIGAVASAFIGAPMLIGGIASELSFGQGSGFAVRGQAASDWIIVFGRQRIGGAQVDCSVSGSGNRWLWEVIAHSAAPIESFDAVYLNGQQAFLVAGTNGLTGNHSGTSNTDFNNTGTSGNVQNITAYDSNWQKYDNFYWDGNARFYIEQYDGTQTQASPFYCANCYYNNGTPHWNSNCILKGTAYSILRYWWNANYMGNPPTVTQDVHGCNVIYDPRLDPSPGVNTTNPSYLIYTENAALILAYYMTNTKFGAGFLWSDININQLIAAANICDEMIPLANPLVINGVSVTQEHQYTINACIDTSQQSGQVIQNMLSAMAGNISYIGGQWYIWPAAWQGVPTSVIYGEEVFLQTFDYNVTQKSRDLFNEVRAQFISPAAFTTTMGPGIDVYQNTSLFNNFNAQWQKSDMVPYSENLARNYAINQWLEEDGGVSYIMNTSFPMTISNATCQRLSKIMLRRNRQQASATITLPLAYYYIVPNDVIAIDYPRYSWTQQLFVVTAAQLTIGTDKNGLQVPMYQLTIQATDPSVYEWCVNSEVLQNDVNQGTTVITDEIANTPNGLSQAGATVALCAPVTNLVAESGAITTTVGIGSPTILCTWVPPVTIQATNNGGYTTGTPNEMVVSGGHYNLQVSTNGAVTWNAVTTITGDTTSYSVTGLNDGTIAYIRIQAVQQNGLTSEWNQVGPITVSDTTLNVSAADVYYGNQGNLLTFAGVNLVPDSNLQFGWTYWNNPGLGWAIEQVVTQNPSASSPPTGSNYFVVPAAGNSGNFVSAVSSAFNLIAGQQYTLSGYIDAYYAAAPSNACWCIYNTAINVEYCQVTQTAGHTGRISTSFTFTPSGVAAGTAVPVLLLFDVGSTTFTNQLLAGIPMIQPGNTMTQYIAGVASLNSQSGLAHGAMSPAVQTAVTSTGVVQNLGGTASSSITPVAPLVTAGTSSVLNRQGNLTGYGNLTFSYTSTTTTIVVSWSAFDLYRSDGTITAISSGSYTFTGLTSSTAYDIGCSLNISSLALDNWMTNATTAGDATTFTQQTLVTVLNADGQVGLLAGGAGAQATTAATVSGGGSGTGGGTGGTPKGCPAIDMFVREGLQIENLLVGHIVDCTDGEQFVESARIVLQPCTEITTETGHRLLTSNSTPFVLPDESIRCADEMDGQMVLTDTGKGTEKVWMKCSANAAGLHRVGVIFVGNRVFAAGTEACKRIYSHNQKIIPVQTA